MTTPTPTTALRDVIEALERATPGPWCSATSFRGIYSQHPAPGPVQVCRAPEHFHDAWKINGNAIVQSANFLRDHADTLRRALAVMEAVEAAPVGTIVACDFDSELPRPVWHVMDDRDDVPLNEPKRVALVRVGEG